MSDPLVVTIDESLNTNVPTPDTSPTGTDMPSLRSRLTKMYKNTESKLSLARRKKSTPPMKVNHLPTVEELLAQMDELQTELLKKDSDLRAASEIGMLLSGVNEEVSTKASNLEVLLEEKSAELSSVQAQFREHQVSHKRFVAMLEDEEKLNESQTHEIAELQQQLATVQAKHEAVSRNASNSVLSTQTEIDLAQNELKESKATKAKLEHQVAELTNKLKREQQSLFTATDELTESRKELQRLKKNRTKM